MTRTLLVVKVGGSLLDQAGVISRLRKWLADAAEKHDLLLIAGGGDAADRLRQQWVAGQISDADAHWLAIRAMDLNSEALAAALELPLFKSPDERAASGVALMSPFLRNIEPTRPGAKLPIGWDVTSDSIAARLAGLLDAGLLLLKSCPPPAGADSRQQLADKGYVDAYFPRASLGLRQVLFDTL